MLARADTAATTRLRHVHQCGRVTRKKNVADAISARKTVHRKTNFKDDQKNAFTSCKKQVNQRTDTKPHKYRITPHGAITIPKRH